MLVMLLSEDDELDLPSSGTKVTVEVYCLVMVRALNSPKAMNTAVATTMNLRPFQALLRSSFQSMSEPSSMPMFFSFSIS